MSILPHSTNFSNHGAPVRQTNGGIKTFLRGSMDQILGDFSPAIRPDTKAVPRTLTIQFRAKVDDVFHNYAITASLDDEFKFTVHNPRENAAYTTRLDMENRRHTCSCGFFQQHQINCKHIFAVAQKKFQYGKDCTNCGGMTAPKLVTVPPGDGHGETTQIGQRCAICNKKEGRF